MGKTQGNFQSTQPHELSDAPFVNSKQANWPTRTIYCIALLALVLGQFGQSSWVGMATGGGLLGWAGWSIFSVIAIAVLYRVYLVVRYSASLNARPPNAAGWLFRGVGWLVMLVGALALIAMFLVKPLTLLIFKTGGPNGIAFFVIGLYATLLSGAGWFGCLLFELSRAMGKKTSSRPRQKTPKQRKQDYSVVALLAILVIGLPYAMRVAVGAPCYGPNLTRCLGTVEGGVVRPAVVPFGEAVSLETNIDEIVFARKGEPPVEMKESPVTSLLKSGHPVQKEIATQVRVVLNATSLDKGVSVTLQVFDPQGESAKFVSTFPKAANLMPAPDNKHKLVIDLPSNVNWIGQTVFQDPVTKQRYLLDEIFSQMRQSIVSPHEAAELTVKVSHPTKWLSETPIDRFDKFEDARPGKSCKDTLRREQGTAETSLFPAAGSPLFRLVFLASPDQQSYMLMQPSDSVGCNGDGVWAFKASANNDKLEIRHYSAQGQLLHFVATSLPVEKNESARIEPDSAQMLGNKITFTATDIAAKGPQWKRKVYEVQF